MVECTDQETPNQEANEQSLASLAVQKQNIELLNSSIPSLAFQLDYLALSRRYCDNCPANSNRSCDCVNVRVSHLFHEIFPPNTHFFKNGNTNNSKKRNQVAVPTGGRRIDEVVHSLEAENKELKRKIELYERKLASIMKQIVA